MLQRRDLTFRVFVSSTYDDKMREYDLFVKKAVFAVLHVNVPSAS